MSKQLLQEYIKKAVREKLEQQARLSSNREKSVYLIYKFPGLKDMFVDLMSPAFPRFILAVEIVSPKPTTFKITLVNNLDFTVTYANKGKFITKISGKKYFMSELGQVERASQAITNLLQLNYNEESLGNEKDPAEQSKTDDLKAALGGSDGGPSSSAPIGPGIDPDAPPDATIPGEEAEPLPGEESGEGEEREEEA